MMDSSATYGTYGMFGLEKEPRLIALSDSLEDKFLLR